MKILLSSSNQKEREITTAVAEYIYTNQGYSNLYLTEN